MVTRQYKITDNSVLVSVMLVTQRIREVKETNESEGIDYEVIITVHREMIATYVRGQDGMEVGVVAGVASEEQNSEEEKVGGGIEKKVK